MLRIEKDSHGSVTTLHLSGRMQSDGISCIQSVMNAECARTILDLREVNLVDIAVVRFLITCENEGVALVHCPRYVREWILRERAESVRPEVSTA